MIYMIADLHGIWQPVRDLHEYLTRTDPKYTESDNTLIILGDVGANFYMNHRDENFKKKLSKYPFTYFCIRGNHEQRPSIMAAQAPSAWHKETFWGNDVWVEDNYPNIKYALDTVAYYNIPFKQACPSIGSLEVDGEGIFINEMLKTLVIPGAYSVDKYYRIAQGWTWFKDEQLTKEEMIDGIALIEKNDWQASMVLSHTCPICFEPTDLFLSTVDQSLVEKDMERYLGQIEYGLYYSVFVWGHFHQYREYPRKNGKPDFFNKRQLMLNSTSAVDLQDVITNPHLVKPIKFLTQEK